MNTEPPCDLELRLVAPERNCFRVYAMTEARTLFGGWALEIAWGRIGAPLRRRMEQFETYGELARRRRALLAIRKRHGYVTHSGAAAPRAVWHAAS